MKNAVVAVLLCSLVAIASLAGCGVQAEVAKEKVIERIDSMLGSMDVNRKEIEHSVIALKDGLTELRKAKIKAQVKHDQISRKVAIVEGKLKRTDGSLKALREHLTSGATVELSGVPYTTAELNELSKRVIRQRQEYVDQIAGFCKAQSRLHRVVESLEAKQTEYEGKLSAIEQQLAVIDSNRLALNAMKDAAEAMDGNEDGLSQSVAQLEEKVNDLYADVEAELIGEDAEWQCRANSRSLTSADAIVEAVQTADDTIGEIDAILSQSQVAATSK